MKHFGPYGDIADNLQSFMDQADTIALTEAKKDDDELIRINLDDQLSAGVDSRGRSLGEYAPYTIELKQAKGQPTDRVTLYDEGDFYAGFNVELKGSGLELDSTDSKTDDLKKDWGESIFGITPDNLTYFINTFFKDRFTNAFRKILLG